MRHAQYGVQMGCKRTGRTCGEPSRGGKLTRCVLDWDDAHLEAELSASISLVAAAPAVWTKGTKGPSQVGFKRTGRACAEPGCGGKLADCVLDWGDELPEAELRASERAANAAGLALCLGTSLQIAPACNLPLRTLRKGAACFQALWLQECQVSLIMAVRDHLRANSAPARNLPLCNL